MDLARRRAAGELAGAGRRRARSSSIARSASTASAPWRLAPSPLMHAGERRVLDAYTAGVNAGLAALAAAPFEYRLLRQTPQPWRGRGQRCSSCCRCSSRCRTATAATSPRSARCTTSLPAADVRLPGAARHRAGLAGRRRRVRDAADPWARGLRPARRGAASRTAATACAPRRRDLRWTAGAVRCRRRARDAPSAATTGRSRAG